MNRSLDTLLDHVAGQVLITSPRKNARPWTKEEDQFVRESLGWLSDEEIGQAIGRTAVAVHDRWDRDLGLPGPSKAPDVITAQKAADMLGIDAHKTAFWVDMELIPGRLMAGARKIRLIDRQVFRRWVLNPMNWVYFRADKVRDPELKRMLKKRSKRWGNEWWSTAQAARYHGTDTGEIKRYIQMGRLPSFRLPLSLGGRHPDRKWSNHFVLKSDAIGMRFYKRGEAFKEHSPFTPAADRFLLKAHDEWGLDFVVIGRMMKIGKAEWHKGNRTIAHHYHQLKARQAKQRKSRSRQ